MLILHVLRSLGSFYYDAVRVILGWTRSENAWHILLCISVLSFQILGTSDVQMLTISKN